MQLSRSTANDDATAAMQRCMQICVWPVDGSKSLETAFQPFIVVEELYCQNRTAVLNLLLFIQYDMMDDTVPW